MSLQNLAKIGQLHPHEARPARRSVSLEVKASATDGVTLPSNSGIPNAALLVTARKPISALQLIAARYS